MPFPPFDQLVDQIIRLRLAASDVVERVRLQVASRTSEELVDQLEKQQILTPFQVERLRTGDTDGLVLGDCKLMYRVASGSFARFYRGASVTNGQQLGIKVLRDRWANDPDFLNLFRREGEIGKRLQHPNIVPIYDVGSDGNYHFLLMEFVEGGSLREFLKIRKKFAPLETFRFAIDILKGLDYALKQGITHRDLKMTNVLMSSTGVAKLIDFGLAADESMISKAGGSLQNALEYATLEKNTGAPRNDPRSDLYFLGGILFELLTGQPPYARTRDRDERKSFQRYRDVPPVETFDPAIPTPVASIVNRLMFVDPLKRYQTPNEVMGDIQRTIHQMGGGPPREESGKPTVLCLEGRPKHQDFFRDYLASRGFQVIIISDPQRALKRISEQPPECILILGETVGDNVADYFSQAIRAGRDSKMAGVVVLAETQKHLASEISVPPGRARILYQPVNLRDVRREIELALEARAKAT